LVLSEVVPIPPQASGFDTRGVVVDPPGEGETRATRVFLTNRTPAALVLGEINPETRKLTFYDNIPLPIGPSRLTRASIETAPGSGVFKTVIIAASFDARSIVVFDPDSRRISNVIRTHRGPYGMVVDATNKLAYISNFTDSTIQVLELDPKDGKPAERITFSVGKPSGPSR
jgi:DNA-binding beta-propeller fold protein YncE